jgi:hypothetical protein
LWLKKAAKMLSQDVCSPEGGMTEYVITEVGHHQWLVFADRQSIAFCADENEAMKSMTEHSARNRRSRELRTEQSPPA